MWKWTAIYVHAENMAKPSPSSLLHLIDDVVAAGAFYDFFVKYSLLPSWSPYFSEATSFKTSKFFFIMRVSEAYGSISTERTLDLYICSFVL